MVCILKEAQAELIFDNYKSAFALTLGDGAGCEKLGITYSAIDFLPSESDINGVLDGDLKAKKVIAKAVKALHNPTKAESSNICLGMVSFINMLTNKNNRDKKSGPVVMVIIEDENNKERNKFLVKYMTALFAEFGIKPVTSGKDIKSVFKKRKAAVKKVNAYMKKHSKANLSAKGVALKKLNQCFYNIEMRFINLERLGISSIGSKTSEALIDTLIRTYSNINLKTVDEVTGGGKKGKKASKKLCKKLAKKNEIAFDAYNSLRDLLDGIEGNPFDKLPKVKYGIDKKGKKTGGPKMDTKKFKKFFDKKKNRELLIVVYAHTAAILTGLEIGEGQYNKHLAKIVQRVFNPDFSKAFVGAAKEYAKTNGSN